MKKIIYTCFIVTLLKSSVLFASSMVYLNQVSDLNITLQPNTPVEFSNPLFFGIQANCSVSTTLPSGEVYGTMLSGSAKLNGTNVGSGLTVTVQNGETLNISASGFAKVSITNKSTQNIMLDCNLA